MGKKFLKLCGLLTLLCCLQLQAQQIDLDTEFGKAKEKINYGPGAAKGKITGVLPTGWTENSNWADVDIDYSSRVSEGRRYLRMNISRMGSGQGQIKVNLPEITSDVTCELVVELRNQSNGPVTFAIRQNGAPYKNIWKSVALTNGEWEKRTFRFKLSKPGFPVGLYLYAPGLGNVDLISVKLQAVDEAELIKRIRREYPKHGPANLLRHTRFIGQSLPMGWSMDRDTSDGDNADIAIDRQGTLTFKTSKSSTLFSEPFVVKDPTVKHQVVARLSGAGTWRLELMNEMQYATGINVQLSSQPKEFVMPFDPDLYGQSYQFRLKTNQPGEVSIHEVKVGPAVKVGKYKTNRLPLLGFDLPEGEAGVAGIQFRDEKPEIKLHTLNAPSGSRIKLVITHGDLKHQETRLLIPSKVQTVNYLVKNKDLLGPYRVEATLMRGGRAISPTYERVVHRLHRPRYWGKDAPDSAFGVHTLSTRRHNTMAKAIGINWVRLHDAGLGYIGWNFLEKKKGQWTFFDEEIKRYRRHDLMIFGELGTAPPWASYYSKSGKKGFGYFDKFFQPLSMKEYANYVSVVTRRYKGVIDHWDVWNEPWIHAWWAVDYDNELGGRAGYKTSKEPQRDFVRLMKTAFETAKKHNPDAVIAGYNTTTSSKTIATRFSGAEWTEGVEKAGGLKYSDVLVYHQYTGDGVGFPGDSVEEGLGNAFGLLKKKYGKYPRPVWMTEGQPLLGRAGNGMMIHTTPLTGVDGYRNAGDRLVRYIASARHSGVSRFFFYSMHAHNGLFANQFSMWKIFTQFDGSLHPSGAAMSAVAWHIDGLESKGRVEVVKGVYAYLFSGKGRTVAILSPQHNALTWTLPVGCEDIWGNPIKPGTKLANEAVFVTGEAAEQWLRK